MHTPQPPLPALVVLCLALVPGASETPALAEPAETAPQVDAPAGWTTGTALMRKRADRIDVLWSDVPLRRVVNGLATSQQVAVLLDRRVDPNQKINLKLNGVELGKVFSEVAHSRGLEVAWVGAVAYIGPPQAIGRVRTVAELRKDEIRKLPAAIARRFLLPRPIGWADFTTPSDLLAQLASEARIEIVGIDQVPHDLWAAANLPPLSLVERLTLVCSQFDLTFQVAADGTAVRLVPLPEEVLIERSYPGGANPEKVARAWAKLAPKSQIEVVSGKILVRGLLEDHQQITTARRSPPRNAESAPRASADDKRFTVREGKGQLGAVLNQLAAQLGVELRIDREALARAGISLDQQITFSAKEATLDELLDAVLAPAGCTFRRTDNVIEIGP